MWPKEASQELVAFMEPRVKLTPHALIAVAVIAFVCQLSAIDGISKAMHAFKVGSSGIGRAINPSEESAGSQRLFAMPGEPSSFYGDLKGLASSAGVSVLSYEEARSDNSSQAAVHVKDIALQSASTYANVTVFLANIQKAYPQVALLSVVMDRKSESSGVAQSQDASAELLVSVRLRTYGMAEQRERSEPAESAVRAAPGASAP